MEIVHQASLITKRPSSAGPAEKRYLNILKGYTGHGKREIRKTRRSAFSGRLPRGGQKRFNPWISSRCRVSPCKVHPFDSAREKNGKMVEHQDDQGSSLQAKLKQ